MGKTYIRVNNIPVAQVYRVAVDNRDPYWVYAGLQDNHSWMGPSATRHWLGILNSGLARDRFQRRHGQGGRQSGLAQGVFVVERRQPVARRSGDRRHDGHHAAAAGGRAGLSLRLGCAGDGVAPHAGHGVSRRQPPVHLEGLRIVVDAHERSHPPDQSRRPRDDGRRSTATSSCRATTATPSARSRTSPNRRSTRRSSGSAPTTATCS